MTKTTNSQKSGHPASQILPSKRNTLVFLVFSPLATLAQGLANTVSSGSKSPWRLTDPIITYWAGPMPMTDDVAMQMAQGGWNLVWITNRGLPPKTRVEEHYLRQLDILSRYGLRGIISLGLWDMQDEAKKAEMSAIIAAIKQHPALYAYHLKDEPSTALFEQLKLMQDVISQLDPARLLYVNLFPIYALNRQLGTSGEYVAAYREYLRLFIEAFKPQLLSFDHYHFAVKGDGNEYFVNLSEIRRAALDAGIPFMMIIQASGWKGSMRIPNGDELRFLTYTNLAFGAKGISHFVYGIAGYDGGMINLSDGSPTQLYYYAKKLNSEFLILAKQLEKFKSLGVYHTEPTPKGLLPVPDSSPLQVIMQSKPAKFDASKVSLLIGLFGSNSEPTHALIVNTDFRKPIGLLDDSNASFADLNAYVISNSTNLSTFNVETSSWTRLNSKEYKLRLAAGDGILIRISS